MIQTVLGPVTAKDLGCCLPHEHVWCDQSLAPRPELLGSTRRRSTMMRLDDFDLMVEELKGYRQAGGRAIVEVTCDGWGRDLDVLARLSDAAEVHIIATAGFYIEPCIPLYADEWSVTKLGDHLTREIEKGVGDSKHRCGVLKSAIHRARVEGVEAKGLRAVALAQKRTGAAITTHTTGSRRQEVAGGTVGIEQLEILKSEEVRPDRLIVGHVDERPDVEVLSRLAGEGCFIQFDVIGKEHYILDATRAELVHELIRRGYVDHLMLSHDCNRHYEMRYGGAGGYLHLFESFLPRLRQLGVTEDQIRTMTVDNPARALTIG
ncbi:MAG: hypothetical protein WD535_05315 [Thermaerobacterales bacterium]